MYITEKLQDALIPLKMGRPLPNNIDLQELLEDCLTEIEKKDKEIYNLGEDADEQKRKIENLESDKTYLEDDIRYLNKKRRNDFAKIKQKINEMLDVFNE